MVSNYSTIDGNLAAYLATMLSHIWLHNGLKMDRIL